MIANLGLLGTSVRLEVVDGPIGARISELVADFPRSRVTPTQRLSLKETGPRHGDGLSLWAGETLVRASMRPIDAVAMLLWQINQVALGTSRNVVLHAGSVARDGFGLVLSAPMEAGKSTLVTHLVAHGFAYLSDEFAPLSLDGRQVDPYPCPITLDTGSFRLFPQFVPDRWAELDDPARWHLRSMDVRPGSGSGPVAVGAFVLPAYRPAAACRLELLKPKEALHRLLGETLNLRSVGAMAFGVIGRLVQTVPTFTLEYGGLDDARDALEDVRTGGAVSAARRKPSIPKRPRPAATATTSVFEHEVVVFCERTERMHCFDRPASIVWAMCDGTRSIDGIVAEVANIAALDTESVRADVVAVLQQFCELGIVR